MHSDTLPTNSPCLSCTSYVLLTHHSYTNQYELIFYQPTPLPPTSTTRSTYYNTPVITISTTILHQLDLPHTQHHVPLIDYDLTSHLDHHHKYHINTDHCPSPPAAATPASITSRQLSITSIYSSRKDNTVTRIYPIQKNRFVQQTYTI